MKTQLIFPSYETIYQHLSSTPLQEKTPLTPSNPIFHRVSLAFAEKTLSVKEAKAQMNQVVTSGINPLFVPSLGSVIDSSLFALLLKCPGIQRTQSGDEACDFARKKSFSLFRK